MKELSIEKKELLLKDICARLPYGVRVHIKGEYRKSHKVEEIDIADNLIRYFENMHLCEERIEDCNPYLRPMSSMTEEEKVEFKWLNGECDKMPTFDYIPVEYYRLFDWLNRNHFDYRGLIEKGLALEATKENNPYK